MATGWAIGRDEPALAILHTTAGLGNAVAALATARVNRAPLVVLVGQQDRRHLAFEPFLAGKLDGLAGDVPGLDRRSRCGRRTCRARSTGPGTKLRRVAARRSSSCRWTTGRRRRAIRRARVSVARAACGGGRTRPRSRSSPSCSRRRGRRRSSSAPGPTAPRRGLRSSSSPRSSPARCGRSRSARGPASRRTIRSSPATSRPAARGSAARSLRTTRCSSSAAPPSASTPTSRPAGRAGNQDRRRQRRPGRGASQPCRRGGARGPGGRLSRARPARARAQRAASRAAARTAAAAGEQLRAGHVFAALAERLPADAILVEEVPSNRPELHARIPARAPLGFVSAAMGGLGFALPAATGLRMARPDRPVVAVVGDGSALYAIQALWSAATYEAGVLFVVLQNGGYAVMDLLASQHGGTRRVARLHRRRRGHRRLARLPRSTHRRPAASSSPPSTRCSRAWPRDASRSCSRCSSSGTRRSPPELV